MGIGLESGAAASQGNPVAFDHQAFVFRSVRLPLRFRWIAVGWIMAETLVFAMLVETIGLAATILLGLGTTILGIVLLRRAGLDAMRGLRQAAGGPGAPGTALPDRLLSALGAILLIIPGFIANAAGLALAAPSARLALIRRLGDRTALRPRGRPDVIDLGPGDWTPIDRG